MKDTLVRLGRDLGLILGLLWIVAVGTGALGGLGPGFDAHAYWLTRSGDFYGQSTVGTADAYLYSPAFAQLLAPLTALPWQLFITIWTAVIVVAYLWLTGPLAIPLLLFFPIALEIHEANIHILLAAMIVLAERWPAAWAFGILTKVTPGVGLTWYAVRREWRPLAIAIGTTAALVGISFVLAPGAWRQWITVLAQGSGIAPTTTHLDLQLTLRLPAAVLLIAWGARANQRWVLPVGVMLALPIVWLNSFAVLLALVPSIREHYGLTVNWLPWRRTAPLAPAGTGLTGVS
jgi:hypothetical protein